MRFDIILAQLLLDRTTQKNIIWATHSYEAFGSDFAFDQEIIPAYLQGNFSALIQPRMAKAIDTQDDRTHDHGEVFTPSWICNEQNNLVDEQWFGRADVFNTTDGQTWKATEGKIEFPLRGLHKWQKYIDTKRMEITCGEAPYLVSRYDTVTGDEIPILQRIGLLDRKLRVVGENTETEQDWEEWALRAFQSIYGYEFQGDSLVIARENLLLTYIEYYQDRFGKWPGSKQLEQIARVISWNLWQMDGLKYVVPFSCKPIVMERFSFDGIIRTEDPCPGCKYGDNRAHTGAYCMVRDWREKTSFEFKTLLKGGRI